MKTTASKLLKTFSLLFTCLLIVTVYNGYTQAIYWQKSIDWGKVLAKETNKLIIADFWANWCGPCLMMDYQVWNDSAICALAQNFVCVKFDLSYDFNGASPYTVDRIPTIMVLDYQGKILYTKTSFTDRWEMQKILSSFPADVSALYQVLEACGQDKKNLTNLVFGAAAYQYYAKKTVPPAKDIFIQESDQSLKKAQKISEKKKDYFMNERIDLMKAQNQILKGNIDKGIDVIIEGLDNLQQENLPLAYYILVTAFLKLGDKDSAMKYYNKLKILNGSEVFVQIVREEFE